MTEEKIYYPQTISDNPFPQEAEVSTSISQTTSGDIISPQTTKSRDFPRKVIATETIGAALNTKSRKILAEFEFTQMGAIQIGTYVNGVSGDMRLTPAGLVGRNTSGITTLGFDTETGSATFAGTIQAGAVIAGIISVGNDTWIIDGDPDAPRIILYNGDLPQIVIGNPN